MLFTSFHFILLFFPFVLVVARALRGPWLLRWITVASLAFYAEQGQPWFIVPMLFTTVLDYALAIRIERAAAPRRKKLLLIVSLCCNLGMLAYFKYFTLLFQTLYDASALLQVPFHLRMIPWMNAVLPSGISFYTFQTISYVVDVYRGDAPAETNFWAFSGFVSFFPHLVAGPLTRHDQLLPGLHQIAREGITSRWQAGVLLFAVGLCKKVLLADGLGNAVDASLHAVGSMTFFPAWLTLLGFGLQIYFDFSGYSDMAIGLGRLLGVELPQNFNSPYKAADPRDFWTRWHITLSRWLRDYLYIPLGGNRRGPAKQLRNLMVTMMLGGLWHGARWTFVAWGVYHGLLLVAFHLNRDSWTRFPVWAQRAATFVLVLFGWMFFRADTWTMALDWWIALTGINGFGVLAPIPYDFLALCAIGFAIVQAFPNTSDIAFETLAPPYQVALGALCAVAILMLNYSSHFLYFRF